MVRLVSTYLLNRIEVVLFMYKQVLFSKKKQVLFEREWFYLFILKKNNGLNRFIEERRLFETKQTLFFFL